MIDLNVLDVISKRKVDYSLVHFAEVPLSENPFFNDDIETWIKNKLKGRYSVFTRPSIDAQGKLTLIGLASFEDHKESTFFMLACPFLRR